jgi:hypothetical protein
VTSMVTPKRRDEPESALLVRRPDAARRLGMSLDSFVRWVEPELRIVRQGRMVLIPVGELDRWVQRNMGTAGV